MVSPMPHSQTWLAAVRWIPLKGGRALQRLKQELIDSLGGIGPARFYLVRRIEGCLSRGELLLARADVMQHLSRTLGEEAAAAQLKDLWSHDSQMQQLQGASAGRRHIQRL